MNGCVPLDLQFSFEMISTRKSPKIESAKLFPWKDYYHFHFRCRILMHTSLGLQNCNKKLINCPWGKMSFKCWISFRIRFWFLIFDSHIIIFIETRSASMPRWGKQLNQNRSINVLGIGWELTNIKWVDFTKAFI